MAQALTGQQGSVWRAETAPLSDKSNANDSLDTRETSNLASGSSRSHDQVALPTDSAQQPVVRRWQDLINASFLEEEPDEDSGRWSPRQSLPFLAMLSLALWGMVLIGALQFTS